MDGDYCGQQKLRSDIWGNPHMVGMNNVWFEGVDSLFQVSSPGVDIGGQLSVVEVVEGLNAAWMGREARKIEIQLSLKTT
jgi:hypothetical protein